MPHEFDIRCWPNGRYTIFYQGRSRQGRAKRTLIERVKGRTLLKKTEEVAKREASKWAQEKERNAARTGGAVGFRHTVPPDTGRRSGY